MGLKTIKSDRYNAVSDEWQVPEGVFRGLKYIFSIHQFLCKSIIFNKNKEIRSIATVCFLCAYKGGVKNPDVPVGIKKAPAKGLFHINQKVNSVLAHFCGVVSWQFSQSTSMSTTSSGWGISVM